jgi:hypothetical protein
MNLENLKQKRISVKNLVIVVLFAFAVYGAFNLEKTLENYLVNNLVIPAQVAQTIQVKK